MCSSILSDSTLKRGTFISTVTTNSSRLLGFIPWTSTKCRTNTIKVKSSQPVSYKCACSLHGFAERLNATESRSVFATEVADLFRLILIASYEQKLIPCMVEAVRECIEACKRTKAPIGPVVELYEFRRCRKSLPAWIILDSPQSDDLSEASTRHLLLQTFLDELPLPPAIRDELYSACADTGFNNFFNRVRIASLKQLQARPETPARHMEVGHSLRLPVYPAETLTVVHTKRGFKLNWFVPDMLQRLQSGLAVGREFVAKGQVWGLYIRTQRGQLGPLGWDIVLCTLKPSQISSRGGVVVSFNISLYEKRKIFSRKSIGFVLHSDHIETSVLPVEGDMPRTQAFWLLSSSTADKCRQYINKDGSCYLMFDCKGLGPYRGGRLITFSFFFFLVIFLTFSFSSQVRIR